MPFWCSQSDKSIRVIPLNPRNPGSSLRIVFFGTPEFAAHILRHLVANGENIVSVVTTPDKPQGRGMHLKSSAVKDVAIERGIPVLTPLKHRDPDFLNALLALRADVFVVVAYKILPMEVISIPRRGAFNVHASLLPKYRGAAPINWAIIRGETETGVTTFLLDQHVDTGQMLLTKRCPIGPDETAGELHNKLMILGAEAALETIRGLAAGTLIPVPQPNSEATTAPKIFPKDCIIDFHRPAEEVHNFIRGLSPHPGAATTAPGGVRLKIIEGINHGVPPPGLEPGKFLVTMDRLFVGTTTRPIEILALQREGKRALVVKEFLKGNKGLFT